MVATRNGKGIKSLNEWEKGVAKRKRRRRWVGGWVGGAARGWKNEGLAGGGAPTGNGEGG